MATFSSLLNSVFDKLYFWRETFSNKAWALEKMRDVFAKKLDQSPDQIEMDDFAAFLHSFYDKGDCSIIQYPGFVMNAVSEMIAGVILSQIDVQEKDLTRMFKLLRSAVTHGQFDKEKRISTMFICLKKLLGHEKTLELMMSCQFDASFALLFAVGSTQNYTRKSAEEYLVELVKFAFNESDNDASLLKKNTKMSLRDALMSLFRAFNNLLMQNCKSLTSNCSLNIVANYCQILSSCAEGSFNWGLALAFADNAHECTFNIWCDLLKLLISHNYCDIGDVVVSSVNQLTVWANLRKHTSEGVTECERLFSLLVVDMMNSDSNVKVSDLIVMAHSIVSRCEKSLPSSDTRAKLLTLSLLPMLVVLGVSIPDRDDNLNHAIEATKDELEKESKTKHSSALISRALSNAFSLLKNKELLDGSIYSSTLEYVTFKTIDVPENISSPFLEQGVVSGRGSLACLASAFKHFQIIIDDPTKELKLYEAEAVQKYIAPFSNFPGISHSDIATALKCYRALMSRLGDCGTPYNKECFVSVLEALELHLVNVDPNLREMAVKEIGQLYLLELAAVQNDAPLLTSKVLPSLWQCVKDKEENVVSQVFEFILCAIESGNTKRVCDHMGMRQEELMTELQVNLLSRQWDNIKPVAFSLYSSLTISSSVIRYAEICLQQSTALAVPAVFKYCTKLFKDCTEWSISSTENNDDCHHGDVWECRVKRLCKLLWEGWGDLVLTALNGDNTTCLRHAVDVLVCIHEFVSREDVVMIVNKNMKEVKLDGSQNVSLADGLEMLKGSVMNYSKSILNGSFFLKPLDIDNGIDNQFEMNDSRGGDAGKMMNITEENIQKTESAPGMEVDIECFDHTVELQPFVLSNKAFVLPDIVSKLLNQLSSSASPSRLNDILILCGFKEFLARLRLEFMKEEVHQSTDEYDRNSITILQDINNSLDSTFKILCEKLEKEIIEVFILELFEILECLMVTSKDGNHGQKIAEESLAKLSYWMKNFLASRDSFFKFVLSHRRKVITGEIDSNKVEILSEFLNSGLAIFRHDLSREISIKSYFTSADGLRDLLNMYDFSLCHTNSNVDCGKPKEDSSLHGDKMTVIESSRNFISDSDVNIKPFTSEDELLSALEDIKKSMGLSDESTSISANSLHSSSSSSTKKTTTHLSLDLLQKMVETCKHCIKVDEKDEQQNLPAVNADVMIKALDQLKEMDEEYDDGFDCGNDPTAIDCY